MIAAFYLGYNGVDTSALAARAGVHFSLLTKTYHLLGWMVEFTGSLFSQIPAYWLYGGVALVAALYATFFGLGAAAYRALYRSN